MKGRKGGVVGIHLGGIECGTCFVGWVGKSWGGGGRCFQRRKRSEKDDRIPTELHTVFVGRIVETDGLWNTRAFFFSLGTLVEDMHALLSEPLVLHD